MTASGSITLVSRRRGDQWYMVYRVPGRKQTRKKIGPAWSEKARPPAGYYTRKMAQAELDALLTDARRGHLPDQAERSGRTFGDAVVEWLRYLKTEKNRKGSTMRDYRNTAIGSLIPEFGLETPLEKITEEWINAYRMRLLDQGGVVPAHDPEATRSAARNPQEGEGRQVDSEEPCR